jgi:hypothetical protein
MQSTVLTGAFEDAAPFLIAFGLFVIVPIVWMMANHQRKMAEIIHRNQGSDESEVLKRLERMQQEITELRQRQNETILAIEDRRSLEVRERVGE